MTTPTIFVTKFQTFRGISTTGTYESVQQQTLLPDKDKGDFPRKKSGGLPFEGSQYAYFADEGVLFAQFMLVNASSEFIYEFTSLQIYTGLALSFFTQSDFDSPAAIASGSLGLDVVPLVGFATIPLAAADSEPNRWHSIGGVVRGGGYELMVGTARAFLGDDTFGPEISFAFAAAAAPEPPSLWLLGSGLAGLMVAAMWRRRRQV